MKLFWTLLLACAVMPAHAAESQKLVFPKWLVIPFSVKTPLTDIYRNSIAQGIWVKTKKEGFLPPVQYFSRPRTNVSLANQTPQLTAEILKNLGVKPVGKMSSTIQIRSGNFRAGAKQENDGYFAEFQSNSGPGIFITCMAFVKMKDNVIAVYTQAYKNSLPTCTKEILDLAKFDHLDRSLPQVFNKLSSLRVAGAKAK